jgi:hypothetical protein
MQGKKIAENKIWVQGGKREGELYKETDDE